MSQSDPPREPDAAPGGVEEPLPPVVGSGPPEVAKGYWKDAVQGLKPRPRKAGQVVGDRVWALMAVGVLLSVAMFAAVAWYLLNPATAARRAYVQGLHALTAGDAPVARRAFTAALARDPSLAEAHFCLGLAYLGVQGAQLDARNIQRLFEQARWGDTEDLDAADRAFERCGAAAGRRPLDEPAYGMPGLSNRELLAYAWSARAATALTRAAAALDTGHATDAEQWLAAASGALDNGELVNPDQRDTTLRELIRQLRGAR